MFSILKKNPKKRGGGGGEQYRKTHRGNRVMHTDVLRKLHFQRHLPLYKTWESKAVVNKFSEVMGGAWEKVSCEETNN